MRVGIFLHLWLFGIGGTQESAFFSVEINTKISTSSRTVDTGYARSLKECSFFCSNLNLCASAEYYASTKACKLYGDMPEYNATLEDVAAVDPTGIMPISRLSKRCAR